MRDWKIVNQDQFLQTRFNKPQNITKIGNVGNRDLLLLGYDSDGVVIVGVVENDSNNVTAVHLQSLIAHSQDKITIPKIPKRV